MDETVIKRKTTRVKREQWAERIAEQERSGLSVKQFCKERGFSEYAFYTWRKRLRSNNEPVRFALFERAAARREPATDLELELVLTTGERLRIGKQVDAATLRMVLSAVRG